MANLGADSNLVLNYSIFPSSPTVEILFWPLVGDNITGNAEWVCIAKNFCDFRKRLEI